MNSALRFSILLGLASLFEIEQISLNPGDMPISRNISIQNFDSMESHSTNCSLSFEKSIFISCEDGWTATDLTYTFMESKNRLANNQT
jgi:hypothetical protein